MRNYKIIRKNQFACSTMQVRRDRKMPVALLKDIDEAIISQAYPVFEIVDTDKLLPEYLMMWFSREEFDRQAEFLAVGGVRGTLEWEDFLEMELPVPSLEKQQEIVNEYNIIANRIKLNDQLNDKLEETAQAIYKHWFVDFEFPNKNGEPYKSSGGVLVYNDKLDREIPKGWETGSLDNLSTQFSGFAFKGDKYSLKEGITVVRGENVTEKRLRWDTHKKWNLELDGRMKKCFLEANDILIGMDGSKVGKNWSLVSNFELPLLLAQRVTSIRGNQGYQSLYLYLSLYVLNFAEYVSQVQTGTSVPHISGQQIKDFPLLIPNDLRLKQFDSIIKPLFERVFINIESSRMLEELKDLLLAKMATVEKEFELTM
ncbi:restriction endonuclease subunit S [Arenibacter algicola]|nr:restriction endonuclease subunit S [Arenibacter algicola]